MGSFANQLFTFMLGWVQGACTAIWQAFTSPAQQPVPDWLREHWMAAALALCLAGALADLIVYLFRWRPLTVWRSFFRRLRERADNDIPEGSPVSAGEEEASEAEAAAAGQAEADRQARLRTEEEDAQTRLERAEESLLRSRRRRFAANRSIGDGEYAGFSAAPQEVFDPQDTYHQPVYPRKWRTNDKNEQHAE